jgi:hypothetical protein
VTATQIRLANPLEHPFACRLVPCWRVYHGIPRRYCHFRYIRDTMHSSCHSMLQSGRDWWPYRSRGRQERSLCVNSRKWRISWFPKDTGSPTRSFFSCLYIQTSKWNRSSEKQSMESILWVNSSCPNEKTLETLLSSRKSTIMALVHPEQTWLGNISLFHIIMKKSSQ